MIEDSEFSLAQDNSFEVTDEVKKVFNENGFIIIRGLLTNDEVNKLKMTLEEDENIHKNVYGRDDNMGGKAKVCLWNHPGKDVTGMIAKSEKVAATFEQLLGGELYHYHSKLIKKDAFEGGSHVWHQDYGYWYNNGCLWPNMGTVFIAVDRATEENGCLRIIPRSHRMGRIDHLKIGDQAGADMTRVNQIIQSMGKEIPIAMNPGDGLFFHCNILHTSAQNKSPNRRWAFLVAYNRVDNNPVIEHHHPRYVPLEKVANDAIMKCDSQDKDPGKKGFFDLSSDGSIRALK